MRHDESYFEDQELSLLYIAKRLNEAQRLEEVLEAAGIDYLVEPDKYRGGIIFPSERIGAFFYVPLMHLPSTREVIQRSGFAPYEVTEA